MKVRRAVLSVSNKDGLIEFAKGLKELDVELIATGGTARLIQGSGIECMSVEEVTGFPEILSGRVKTLHPAIMAGILARRDVDLEELASLNIKPVDLVVVNLYPFEETAFSEDHENNEILEEIDIGGCTLLRAAAKNHPDVAVVCSPDRYGDILEQLRGHDGRLDAELRVDLAREAFHHTAIYDSLIAEYFDKESTPEKGPLSLPHFSPVFKHAQNLRYGENPHQAAAFFRELFPDHLSVSSGRQLHGKELSYNNILDLDSAISLVADLPETSGVIMKHTNPCGVGLGETTLDAYQKALATDPMSAFGSIIAYNVEVGETTAEEMKSLFVECVVAPSFSDEALRLFEQKKNLRIIELPGLAMHDPEPGGLQLRSVRGGMLVQDKDDLIWDEERLTPVSDRKVAGKEMEALRLAWIVCKHIKSNGIVLATFDRTIGIGTGQMSRIDSVDIALMKARKACLSAKGSVMASDAFFPFRDSVDRVAGEGVTAIVQPGGSIRDEEVIQAANEKKIAMIFTGIRHFRH